MILNFCFSSVVGKPFAIPNFMILVIKGLRGRLKWIGAFYGQKESKMFWTIGLSLFILWLLGFLGGYTGGGIIHILLAVAIIVVPTHIIQG
jgi:hypothetical protein